MSIRRPFRTFGEVCAFLDATTDYEKERGVRYTRSNFDLDAFRDFLRLAGDPHRRFRVVHIAGTKGKGSTAIMVERILRTAGFRTGLYTSPHLIDMRERIQLMGRWIGEKEFVAAANDLLPAIRRSGSRPTYFDLMTAIAFAAFARARVEYAVIEVGLGGRLDSTNVVAPSVVGIARIDYDHTDKLGKTLARIAGEKAGIIKPGVPVVCAPQRSSAMEVIKRHCRAMGAPLANPRATGIRSFHRRRNVLQFDWRSDRLTIRAIRLPAAGRHQVENAAVAIGLTERLVKVPATVIRSALATVRLPGRVEIVARDPVIVVDAAHNPVSIGALIRAIREGFRFRRCLLVFGCLEDKDVRRMMAQLREIADFAIFTAPRSRRAVAPSRLAEIARGIGKGLPILTVAESAEAVRLAKRIAARDDLVVVCGSFYLAGEALVALRGGDGEHGRKNS